MKITGKEGVRGSGQAAQRHRREEEGPNKRAAGGERQEKASTELISPRKEKSFKC